jgi:MFS family permease
MTAIFSLPIIGFLLDKFNRSKIITIILLIDVFLAISYANSKDPSQLMVIRSFHGAAGLLSISSNAISIQRCCD